MIDLEQMMNVLEGIDGLIQLPPHAVASIGNFDGIHRGHASILELMRELRARSTGPLAVITFEPHPLTVLRPELAPPRLTPAGYKQELLRAAGVEYLVILPPSRDVLNLTAEEFWRILRDQAKVSHLVEGPDFAFGKGRRGNLQVLREWASQSAVEVRAVEPVEVALLDLSIARVSSSLIRWLLACGRVRDAAICLGRPYLLEGRVVQGHQRGRSLGVPTANLACSDQLIPADAVYAGRSTVNGVSYPAAVSIGTNPTFGDGQRSVEAHLIGFDSDLYDQTVRLELLDFLRDQHTYKSIEALRGQLARDIADAEARSKLDPAAPIAVLS